MICTVKLCDSSGTQGLSQLGAGPLSRGCRRRGSSQLIFPHVQQESELQSLRPLPTPVPSHRPLGWPRLPRHGAVGWQSPRHPTQSQRRGGAGPLTPERGRLLSPESPVCTCTPSPPLGKQVWPVSLQPHGPPGRGQTWAEALLGKGEGAVDAGQAGSRARRSHAFLSGLCSGSRWCKARVRFLPLSHLKLSPRSAHRCFTSPKGVNAAVRFVLLLFLCTCWRPLAEASRILFVLAPEEPFSKRRRTC